MRHRCNAGRQCLSGEHPLDAICLQSVLPIARQASNGCNIKVQIPGVSFSPMVQALPVAPRSARRGSLPLRRRCRRFESGAPRGCGASGGPPRPPAGRPLSPARPPASRTLQRMCRWRAAHPIKCSARGWRARRAAARPATSTLRRGGRQGCQRCAVLLPAWRPHDIALPSRPLARAGLAAVILSSLWLWSAIKRAHLGMLYVTHSGECLGVMPICLAALHNSMFHSGT